MASSSDALPPEFLQRAQQGGIVVTGRLSFPSCHQKFALCSPSARSRTSCPPTFAFLTDATLAEIPKLDLESYVQNYRGTWRELPCCCVFASPLIRSERPHQTR